MFLQQRATGLWTFDSVIEGNELAYWDAHFPDAIDGNGGGAYHLTDDLSIGSDPGVSFTLDALVFFANDVQFLDFATFFAQVAFNNTVSIGDDLQVSGLTNFLNDVQFQTNAFFYDNVTFNEDVTIANTAILDVYGNSHFRGVTQIGDTGADILGVYALAQFHDIAQFFFRMCSSPGM